MLTAIRARSRRRRLAARLCATLSARAREPVFFRDFGVADTFDGRFDLLVLHAWLVLDRLDTVGARDLAQALVDTLFVGLDEGLREQGAGDMGMSRRMKKMASAFYGRLGAYGEAADERDLGEALVRNLYRGEASHVEDAMRLAKYVSKARERLAGCHPESGEVDFGPLPEEPGEMP
jgi:cytochrome b pre-mRNA-processing protein 3